MTDVKFCGMTRDVDVREAVRLGATYIGAILTESPRRVTPGAARALFDAIEVPSVHRVGVFGNEPLEVIIDSANLANLDIVQLHGSRNSDEESLARLHAELGASIWRVLRVRSEGLAPEQRAVVPGTDGLLLDTMTKGALGGSGVTFRWDLVASDVRALRSSTRIILAGGLRPENVGDAINLLAPDVVDVSSGVESQPGIKDHSRMAAFMNAVRRPSAPSAS